MKTNLSYSRFQKNIFDFIKNKVASAIIEAVAGSGKTTTIIEALNLIPSNFRILFLAFNRAIADELSKRVPSHVMAKTFHSVCFASWQRFVGTRLNVEANKVKIILKDILTFEEFGMYATFCNKLISLAKNSGMGFIIPDNEESWLNLISYYDLTLDNEDAKESYAIEICQRVLKLSIEKANRVIDYDDMLFMPLIKNVSFYQNDYVFVDEAQDTNAVQRALLKRMLKPKTGRLIAVGDTCQAIYGFRGADSKAMKIMQEDFNAESLPLSICYRCAKSVVKLAQTIVPHIEYAENAPEGKVEKLTNYNKDTFTATDAIICRNTAPLIEMAYALISKNIGCKVLGREIGQGLVSLINKMKGKGINGLIEKLNKYKEREIAKCIKKGNEVQAGAIEDKVTCIQVIINHLSENDRTIPALITKIDSLFTDKNSGCLTLCTAHKSKGTEYKRVFILDFEKYMPSKWARQDWQQEQEQNLIYVAYTRAKEELYFIESGKWVEQNNK